MKTANKFVKFLCLVLGVIICLTACACGCGGDKDSNITPPDKKPDEVIKDTGKYIVKDGASDYQILVPVNADYNITLAANEAVSAIKEACGYKMKVTSEYDTSKKYISIGDTELYNENESAVAATALTYTEVRVKTLNDNVIVNGDTTLDTVYATYEFLERTVGFKVYTLDDVFVVKTDNVKLYDIDLREKPDISVRSLRYSRIYDADRTTERLNHARMRADYAEDAWFTFGHNQASVILPKTTYYEAHSDWYSTTTVTNSDPDVGQLCLSNEEMQAEFIKRVKEIIQNDTDFDNRKFFMIGMQDNWNCCKCEGCRALASANGGDDNNRAAVEIIFANKVSKAINDDWEWLKQNHPGKHVQFVIFAYFFNASAPVKDDAAGTPVPYNENVKCDDRVSVLFAPLTGDFARSLADDKSRIGKQVKKWLSVCNNFMYYSYCAQFGALPVPINDLITLDGTVNTLIANGGYYMQEQGATLTNTSGMEELAWYVRSNFMWDASKSVDEYAYEFIDYYYMPVAESFKKYYDAFKSFQIYQVEELGLTMIVQDLTYATDKWFGKNWLDTFNAMLDGMIGELEGLKTTDPAAYEKYFARINKEKIWIYYIYCDNYKKYFNEKDYNEMVEFMRKYCAEYGINEYREYRSISEKIDGWQ